MEANRFYQIFFAITLLAAAMLPDIAAAAERAQPKRPKDEFAAKLAAADKDDPKALKDLAAWCRKSGLKIEEKQVSDLIMEAEYRQRFEALKAAPDEKKYDALLAWCKKNKLAESEAQTRRWWNERLYAEKASATAENDLNGQMSLAEWCRDRGLYLQAVQHARAVLRADPKNAAAKSLVASCAAKARSKEKGLLSRQRVPGYSLPTAWYHLWVPPAYNPDKPMPLYIWLHGGHVNEGSADNTVALHQVIPEFKANLALFPNHQYHFWTHPREMLYLLDTIDEVMLRFNVDPKRIYIMGSSMGGSGTWAMAANFPELFAACSPNAAWCEYIPVEKAAAIPIYINHGSQDGTVPVKWSREAYAKIKDLPGAKIEYHELNCGHQLPTEALAAAAKWISQFANPRTFDLDEIKACCRALPLPPWANQPQYKWPEEAGQPPAGGTPDNIGRHRHIDDSGGHAAAAFDIHKTKCHGCILCLESQTVGLACRTVSAGM